MLNHLQSHSSGPRITSNWQRLSAVLAASCFLPLLLSLFAFCLLIVAPPSYASSGTEGAAFLDIPVGGAPAALAGAYTALATDAYAPLYNPSGLGVVDSNQISAMHLSYLDSISYECASFVHPLGHGKGFGLSAQYLHTGDIPGADMNGNPTGSYSSYYGAYNISYGQQVGSQLALGASAKLVNASLDGTSASAYALDLGSLYQLNARTTLAASLTNLGTSLKFLDQPDPLPMAFHVSAAFHPINTLTLVGEEVYERQGLASTHLGTEWNPMETISLRMGYRTDTTPGLSLLAGLTTGIGIHVWGQEFDYAWLPAGDLGNTHYFSIVIRFGEPEQKRKNLINYNHLKGHTTAKNNQGNQIDPDYQQLMMMLNDQQQKAAQLPTEGHP